jgi:pimeloyl-ACP methyl ester carboxylesterase
MEAAIENTQVISADGTAIAVSVTGTGDPLVIVHGSLGVAADWQAVADELAADMTVYVMDRRGRAGSVDTTPFSFQREQEDVAAVLRLAGPGAVLLGHSYGGLIALETAVSEPVAALVVYEPPFPIDGAVSIEALPSYEQAIAEGRPDDALALGMRAFVGLPDGVIEYLRTIPALWSSRVELAPTWSREVRAVNGLDGDVARFAAIHVPTLVLVGEVSPSWLPEVSRSVAAAIPGSRVVTLANEAHEAHISAPTTLASEIRAFVARAKDESPQR